MPELPEVEIVARQLRNRLIGRTLQPPTYVHPQILEAGTRRMLPQLAGARVAAVQRRGKLLLIELDPTPSGPLVLTLHLRMTGRVRFSAPRDPLAVHTHLRLPVAPDEELRFSDQRRFGRVGIYRRSKLGSIPLLQRLGPEATDVDAATLAARLARRPGPIKGALLDQSLVAGLGNIYVDEILFAARVHPQRPARSLRQAEVAAVVAAMRRVLAAAIQQGGSTIRDYRAVSDAPGRYQRRHRVFRRDGWPCPRCAGTIAKIRVAGRGTHICPRCQPWRPARARGGK